MTDPVFITLDGREIRLVRQSDGTFQPGEARPMGERVGLHETFKILEPYLLENKIYIRGYIGNQNKAFLALDKRATIKPAVVTATVDGGKIKVGPGPKGAIFDLHEPDSLERLVKHVRNFFIEKGFPPSHISNQEGPRRPTKCTKLSK